MNQDILLSKIIPTPTDITWAQAYTTLNVYITLSIENEQTKIPVTAYGKELLEKLQREFFALDQKNLENIKNAVGNVSKTIEEGYTYSIIVGAIVEDILYIVIASEGQVIVKRGETAGVIAKGIPNELHGYSGKLRHDDIVVLETGDFSNKIPLASLQEYLSSNDVLKIAEDITPLTHDGAKGTESAIILQFKDIHSQSVKESPTDTPDKEMEITRPLHDKDQSEEESDDDISRQNLWETARSENRNIEELSDEGVDEPIKKSLIPQFKIPQIDFANKRILLLGAALLLVLIIVGGVFYQVSEQRKAQNEAEFGKIYNPAKEKFDAGASLASLNGTLALEDLNSALSMVNDALKNYSEGSSEYTRLSELKSQIEDKISSLGGGGEAQNAKEFLKPTGNLKSITAISARSGVLVVLDSEGEQVVAVGLDGKIDDSYDIKTKASYISSDDKFIYTMGTTVVRIDKGNGNVTKVLDKAEGDAIDLFGSNFYILNENKILKYRAPSDESSDYFTEDPGFSDKATSMSISGSIYVVEENGKLSRFTRGKKDDFEVTGLQATVGEGGLVYADPDNSDVYIMDVKNQRVVVLSEEGAFKTQYEGSFIKNAKSFAVDEENKIGYVVSNNTITSFDL